MPKAQAKVSFTGSLSSQDLERHILRSYFMMRAGIALIGLAFPFLLLFGGMFEKICPQSSMSAYYHAIGPGQGSMRNWFVGLLFSVSIALGLYRGFSRIEDRLLDAAALLGIGIAVFPMPWTASNVCGALGTATYNSVDVAGYSVHDICSFSFFVCIAFVCWFCADDTLPLVGNPTLRHSLKATYRTIAVLMPTMAFLAWGLTRKRFWAECTAVVAFGVYWLLKGLELNHTGADLEAALGKLMLNNGEVEDVG